MERKRGLVDRVANVLTIQAVLLGIPRPPYTRSNAIVVETAGRRTGRRHRVPVGFVEEEGKLIVVAEDGAHAGWVRNALGPGGRLRVHLRGKWRGARLRMLEGDPEPYLQRMTKLHAYFVRRHSSTPQAVEITVE